MEASAPSEMFVDWWFAPWRYARKDDRPALHDCVNSLLGRRDAYRHWCALTSVTPHMPSCPDWQWQAAASSDTDELLQAAELFGGLLAARRQRHDELAQLAPPQRRWCLSVASTQPLRDWAGDLPEGAHSPRERGLLELALRLERGFPGMWSRLRLLLPAHQAEALAPLLGGAGASVCSSQPLRERDRRCWLMCVSHSRAS